MKLMSEKSDQDRSGALADMLEVVVLDDPRDFAALEEEWEELYHDSPLATPFQSWAWLYSWWEFYSEGYELRLVTVRSGDLLVGLIPLMLERRWGFGRLLFIGNVTTDYLDVLVREGWEAEVSEAGRQAIKDMGSWRVADLQEVHPGAAAWDIFRSWTGPRTHVWQASCPVIEVKPWDELVSSLSKNHRSTVRRALRRAEADGVRCEVAKPADAEWAARRLVAVSREQWEGNPLVGPEHWTQRFESHVVAAVRRMAARGLGGGLRVLARRRGDNLGLLGLREGFLGDLHVGRQPESPPTIPVELPLHLGRGEHRLQQKQQLPRPAARDRTVQAAVESEGGTQSSTDLG